MALLQQFAGTNCQLSGSIARLSLHAGGNVVDVLMTLQHPLTYTYTLVSSTPSDMTQHTFGCSNSSILILCSLNAKNQCESNRDGMHDFWLQRHGLTWIPLLMQDTIVC